MMIERCLRSRLAPHLVFSFGLVLLLWRAPSLEFYLSSPDHGYQLALGRQVVLGKFPFVDLFFHYGPLTALTGALGIWIRDSLVTETFICAVGYALAFLLLHRVALVYVSPVASLVVPVMGFSFLARFYKWYYWLFPLVSLYLLHRLLERERRRPGLVGLAGAVSGLAWLYRFDLGLACLGLLAISLGAQSWREQGRRSLRAIAALFAGFAVPLATWLAALLANNGISGIRDYAASTLGGTWGAVEKMSRPIPPFQWNQPLSQDSGTAVLYVVVPLTYVVCLFMGWRWTRLEGPAGRRGWFVFAAGLLGLGLFPQALHRADSLHLLQTIPPFFLTFWVLLIWLWRPEHGASPTLSRVAAVAYLLVVALAGWTLRYSAASDLGPWARNPVHAWWGLDQGVDADTSDPHAQLIRAIEGVVGEGESILVGTAMTESQLYYFARRRLSGFLVTFVPGILDTGAWRRRNLQQIQADPPDAIIVREDFTSADTLFRRLQPELYAYLSMAYLETAYEGGGWRILRRSR